MANTVEGDGARSEHRGSSLTVVNVTENPSPNISRSESPITRSGPLFAEFVSSSSGYVSLGAGSSPQIELMTLFGNSLNQIVFMKLDRTNFLV
ncbi:hypothetical protein Syun_022989 [Stephania yunnanensis]|uniref:Uncharacterized protein n=1 Tax=Stephania yunnanensis TaxID=152371 RepID=A0AAP0HZ41_9MAGN